jgi:hypothetical protein
MAVVPGLVPRCAARVELPVRHLAVLSWTAGAHTATTAGLIMDGHRQGLRTLAARVISLLQRSPQEMAIKPRSTGPSSGMVMKCLNLWLVLLRHKPLK